MLIRSLSECAYITQIRALIFFYLCLDLGINQFSDLTATEFKSQALGYIPLANPKSTEPAVKRSTRQSWGYSLSLNGFGLKLTIYRFRLELN